jgi:hypothetical protein
VGWGENPKFARSISSLPVSPATVPAKVAASSNFAGVRGTGAVGTATQVTVDDASLSVTIALINQYANQFAVNASDYDLAADNNSQYPGTQLQLATAA